MKIIPLSADKLRAIRLARQNGGALRRFPQGRWGTQSYKWRGSGAALCAPGATVYALVRQGLMRYADYQDGTPFRAVLVDHPK